MKLVTISVSKDRGISKGEHLVNEFLNWGQQAVNRRPSFKVQCQAIYPIADHKKEWQIQHLDWTLTRALTSRDETAI